MYENETNIYRKGKNLDGKRINQNYLNEIFISRFVLDLCKSLDEMSLNNRDDFIEHINRLYVKLNNNVS
jgi:hypothetical protein